MALRHGNRRDRRPSAEDQDRTPTVDLDEEEEEEDLSEGQESPQEADGLNSPQNDIVFEEGREGQADDQSIPPGEDQGSRPNEADSQPSPSGEEQGPQSTEAGPELSEGESSDPNRPPKSRLQKLAPLRFKKDSVNSYTINAIGGPLATPDKAPSKESVRLRSRSKSKTRQVKQ